MRSRSAFQLRAAAFATAATLALGAAACGGSDDDSDGGGDDQAQARATVERLYTALRASDAAKACEELTEAGQKQLQEGGRGPDGKSCAETFQKFLDRNKKAEGVSLATQAKITSVKVKGETAVAKVRFGKGGPNGDIDLEQVDGEWKVSAAGASPSN